MAQNFIEDLHTLINTNQKNTALPMHRGLRFLGSYSPFSCVVRPFPAPKAVHESPHHNLLVSAGLEDWYPPTPRRAAPAQSVFSRERPAAAADSLQTRPRNGLSHPPRPHGARHHPASQKHIPPPAVGAAHEPLRSASEQLTPRNPAQEGAAGRNRAGGGTRLEPRPAPVPGLPLACVPVRQPGPGQLVSLRYLCGCGAGPRQSKPELAPAARSSREAGQGGAKAEHLGL